jgi:hypothetical protein
VVIDPKTKADVWVLQLFGDRAVEVKSSAKFEAGVRKALFEARFGGRSYDVSRDGRFLIPADGWSPKEGLLRRLGRKRRA